MQRLRIYSDNVSVKKGKIEYYSNGVLTQSSAFLVNDEGLANIFIPKELGTVGACVELYNEAISKKINELTLEYKDSFFEYDVYEFPIDLRKLGVGLYFFRILLDTVYGKLYGFKLGNTIHFTKESIGEFFQISVSDFKYDKPKDMYGGIIYHIFVDRFNRGGKNVPHTDEIIVDDWSLGVPEYPEYNGAHLKNNCFYGGTLYGIIDKLDYLSSLGVSAIYLSPIFEAKSNHKYDTADYMKIDSMFGGEEAFLALVKECKKRKIGIILDGVFNHTGSDSIYFNKHNSYESLGAYQSKQSQYFNWYDFKCHPNDYTCWWGIEILPRINPDNPDCRKFFVGDGGVIDKYASLGILGFRLDVADELSDDFIAQIKQTLNKYNKNSVLYGEVWEDASNKIAYGKRKKYYLGKELDGVMNYPLRSGIIDFLKHSGTEKLNYALTDIIYNSPKRIRDMQMNLLGTHDTERIITVLGGEESRGKTNSYLAVKRMSTDEKALAKKRLMLAYTIIATLPGVPCIFYGDEAGLEGYSDPFNRMPFPFGNEDFELLEFYRRLGEIRSKNPVYKTGEYELISLTEQALIFKRISKAYEYVTVINNSEGDLTVSFECEAKALINKKISSNDEKNEYTVGGFSSEIFKIKKHD